MGGIILFWFNLSYMLLLKKVDFFSDKRGSTKDALQYYSTSYVKISLAFLAKLRTFYI